MASVANQKYRNIKRCLFPHGGVARRCHRPNYVAASRLALRKNPSVLFVPLFLIRDTRLIATAGLLLLPSWAFAAPDTTTSLLTVLLSLALILGGFVAVAWFARRYLPGMGAQGVVKVVGTTAVGTRERVVVVEVDNTWLLLGVGGGNVRLLHTLPKPDDARAREQAQ
jgi:flagellar protein FliO/FliZ